MRKKLGDLDFLWKIIGWSWVVIGVGWIVVIVIAVSRWLK